MSESPSVFYLLSEIIRKEAVRCVLIGGYAVNYHKVSRQTGDIDFMIIKEDFERISPALEKAGYRQDNLHANFVQLKNNNPLLIDIDFMFVDKSTFDKILKNTNLFRIGGGEFLLPSLENLLALKLHSIKFNYKIRWIKDLPDIINLIKANRIDTTTEEFKKLSLKFGTPEIYQKIRELADGRS